MLHQGIASPLCLVVALATTATKAGLLETRQSTGYSSLPYYPAPFGGWNDEWAESYEKAKSLVDSMTLAARSMSSSRTVDSPL